MALLQIVHTPVTAQWTGGLSTSTVYNGGLEGFPPAQFIADNSGLEGFSTAQFITVIRLEGFPLAQFITVQWAGGLSASTVYNK